MAKKMIRYLFLCVLLTNCGDPVEKNTKRPLAEEKYTPDWESLKKYEVPKWFNDAKLGIFIHWGPYAVPAYCNEWYPKHMYDSTYTRKHGELFWHPYKYHKETYGDQKEFGYKDFIPMFKAEKFDAQEWLDVFEQAGAKYIVPVGEHHDGFAMYASTLTPWNSVKMGPKRDIAGELEKEARARNLKFGISSHYTTNWDYYPFDDRFDTTDPKNVELYGRPHGKGVPADKQFVRLFENRTKEMIDLYKPDLIWFDGGLAFSAFMEAKLNLAAYYYNKGLEWNKGVVYNYKNNKWHIWPDGCGVLDIERGKLGDIRKEAWQTDTALGLYNWGYTQNMIVKSADTVIDDLIDIVSKNGNLLLNVSPKADGTIPENQKKVLFELGKWLQTNGEAIYGTRPWKIFGEGPTSEDLTDTHMAERRNNKRAFSDEDLRFTTKGKDLFVICLGEAKEQLVVKSLKDGSPYYDYEIERIEMLGSNDTIVYEKTDDGLIINLPENKPDTSNASTFKIHFGELRKIGGDYGK